MSYCKSSAHISLKRALIRKEFYYIFPSDFEKTNKKKTNKKKTTKKNKKQNKTKQKKLSAQYGN